MIRGINRHEHHHIYERRTLSLAWFRCHFVFLLIYSFSCNTFDIEFVFFFFCNVGFVKNERT
ncbi:hypothetical protein HanRHA438_Chr12g0536421 [Helianthus annuus]|nr:hypothetical protein HanRHA438_Chr12g0536421 [Helianthus annuus]